VEGLASTLGYDHSFAISSSGRSGGIGLFWTNEIKIDILPNSQYHLDVKITEAEGDPWRLTCVYGEAQVPLRFKTWDVMKHIKSANALPWVCIGDFNEVLHQHENVGPAERNFAQMQGFRNAVDVCELADLGYEGRS
jgi:hypothetical protein